MQIHRIPNYTPEQQKVLDLANEALAELEAEYRKRAQVYLDMILEVEKVHMPKIIIAP